MDDENVVVVLVATIVPTLLKIGFTLPFCRYSSSWPLDLPQIDQEPVSSKQESRLRLSCRLRDRACDHGVHCRASEKC